MKILHIAAGGPGGGAWRGAYWLHRAQREMGLDSTFLTIGRGVLDDPSVISLGVTLMQRLKFSLLIRIGTLPTLIYRNRKPVIFSTGFEGIDITKYRSYDSADIVHLHWVNGLVRIRPLRKVKKPLVWTMRDMWPLTGGCHVGSAFGCELYKSGCGSCPQLKSQKNWDLSRLVVLNKRASLPKQLQVVGISRWLSECASQSCVFEGFSVRTISNNIDTQEFFPIDSQMAREILGIPKSQKLVLVGADTLTSFYKGFDLFLDAMRKLRVQGIRVLTFGRGAGAQLVAIGVEHTDLGYLSDTLALRIAYSAADVFVAPSRMDAFGKTLAEAMACGTPVVCFDATGPRDIVDHKVTGYRAVPFESSDLAEGVEWVLTRSPAEQANLRLQARERVVRNFDSRFIAHQYKALYEEMLAD